MHGIVDSKSKECSNCLKLHKRGKKGKFQVRKLYTLFMKPFQKFMESHYLPMSEKYAYHHNHIILLEKYEITKDRKNALRPSDVETTCDYVEILSFEVNYEIMSQNFGDNLSLSIEGASVSFFKRILSSVTKRTYLSLWNKRIV